MSDPLELELQAVVSGCWESNSHLLGEEPLLSSPLGCFWGSIWELLRLPRCGIKKHPAGLVPGLVMASGHVLQVSLPYGICFSALY